MRLCRSLCVFLCLFSASFSSCSSPSSSFFRDGQLNKERNPSAPLSLSSIQFDRATVTRAEGIPFIPTEELEKKLGLYHEVLHQRDNDTSSGFSSYSSPVAFSSPPSSSPSSSSSSLSASSYFLLHDAFRYMIYCHAAYSDDPNVTLSKWDCPWCVNSYATGFKTTHVIQDKKTDTLAFVGYNKARKEVVATFRGTDSFANWVLDVQFWPTKQPFDGIPDVFTASGFYECFAALREPVYNALLFNMYSFPSYTPKIVGHSLGGAIASLTALDFVYNAKIGGLASYTFGSPRVGNLAFSTTFSSSISSARRWRMTHNNDPVPHVPPVALGGVHVNQEVFQFDEEGKYILCDPLQNEDPVCSDRYKYAVLSMNIKAHKTYMNETLPTAQ